jgi:hypothetical protein
MAQDPDELTIVEAAVLPGVDVHPGTIDRLLRSNVLAYRWQSGRRLVHKGDVLAWAAARRRHYPLPARKATLA